METICSTLDANQPQLQEFRDIADRIWEQYQLRPDTQFVADMHLVVHNLVRSAQNKDIECALLQRHIGMLLEGADIAALIKDNMGEILKLKIENS